MSKGKVAFGVILIIVIASVGFLEYMRTQVKPIAHHPAPVTIQITTVKQVLWHDRIPSNGTLFAHHGTMLQAQVAGQIIKIYAQPSSHLVAGQKILKIDPEGLQKQLLKYQAQLTLAQIHLSQMKILFDKKLEAKWKYEQAQAAVNVAEANVEQTQMLLNKTMVTAPFSGKLGIFQKRLGDYVVPGDLLASLQNNSRMDVAFSIPAVNIRNISIGQIIHMTSPAFPDKVLTGKVYGIDVSADQSSRSVEVHAELISPPKHLITGLYGSLHLIVSDTRQVLAIPQTAVKYSPEGSYVFKVVDGIAKQVPVILGERSDHNVIVKKGLAKGDLIVGLGYTKVRDGAAVVNHSL